MGTVTDRVRALLGSSRFLRSRRALERATPWQLRILTANACLTRRSSTWPVAQAPVELKVRFGPT
jgi:hypothetical protein